MHIFQRSKPSLDEKLDKIIAREFFTKYKRAPTEAERETFQKAYLDHKGILDGWEAILLD